VKPRRVARRSARQRGASAIEFAIAAPVLLVLGLGALQWALVFHARQAVEHAAIEAARAGSRGHALPEAIATGLARGLLPYWAALPAVRSAADREQAVAAARARVAQASAAGWIVVRMISPTVESFADWGEPALDGFGRPIAGLIEIPNDSLEFAEQRSPRGGSGSGQSLLDANVLKIEIVYGVPLDVPLVGRIAAAAGRLAVGCLDAARGGCGIWQAADATGRRPPRWPVSTIATMRMQSPARQSAATPSRAAAIAALPGPRGAPPGSIGTPPGSIGTGGGAGIVDPLSDFRLQVAPNSGPYGGLAPAQDGSLARLPDGWLSLGGDRSFSIPGACAP
jgi:hypothetical protein